MLSDFRKPSLPEAAPPPQAEPLDERSAVEADIHRLTLEIARLSRLLQERRTRLVALGAVAPLPSDDADNRPLHPPGPPFPILLLPLELLQQILLVAHLADPTALTRTRLTHTCARFRAALLSLPAAWARFSVPLRQTYTPGEVARVREELERAKNAPLDVRLSYDLGSLFPVPPLTNSSPTEPAPPSVTPLDLLLSRLSSWHTASLDLRDHPSSTSLLQQLTDALDHPDALPRLKMLEFRTGVKRSERLDGILEAFLAGAAGLEEMEVWTSGEVRVGAGGMKRGMKRLFWGGWGRAVSVEPVAEVLNSLPNLEMLSLPALEYPPSSAPPLTIRLPQLWSLSLTLSATPSADAALLSAAVFPRLVSLDVRGARPFDSDGEGRDGGETEGRRGEEEEVLVRAVREKGWRLRRFEVRGVDVLSGD